jgi:hypothetical protein
MTPKTLTILWNLACAVAALAAEILADPQMLNLFPAKYAHAIALVAFVATWIRAHKNIFLLPDGSAAPKGYVPPPEKQP